MRGLSRLHSRLNGLGPKKLINIRILQTMVSGIPLTLGLRTRLYDPDVNVVLGAPSTVETRKLENGRPVIPKPKKEGKPASITLNPCSTILESTVGSTHMRKLPDLLSMLFFLRGRLATGLLRDLTTDSPEPILGSPG